MIVKCIYNSGGDIGRDVPLHKVFGGKGDLSDRKFSIVIGKEYVVYGMTIRFGIPWYYICDEDYTYYPIWNPATAFEIVDGRISSSWCISSYLVPGESSGRLLIAFPEWANNPYYYDKLTDGDEDCVELFRKYKIKIDSDCYS